MGEALSSSSLQHDCLCGQGSYPNPEHATSKYHCSVSVVCSALYLVLSLAPLPAVVRLLHQTVCWQLVLACLSCVAMEWHPGFADACAGSC
jgi:hypothetical protein